MPLFGYPSFSSPVRFHRQARVMKSSAGGCQYSFSASLGKAQTSVLNTIILFRKENQDFCFQILSLFASDHLLFTRCLFGLTTLQRTMELTHQKRQLKQLRPEFPSSRKVSPICPHFSEPSECKRVREGLKGNEKTKDRGQVVDKIN